MRLLQILLLFIITIPFSYAQNDALAQAETAFNKKDYKKSIQLYESVLQEKPNSPDVLFNIGNSYLLSEQLAKAIFSYEKALIFKPGNSDIISNLAIANDKLENPIFNINNFYLSNGYWNTIHSFRSLSFMIFTIILIILFLFAIAFLLFKDIYLLNKYKWIWSIFLLLFIGILYKMNTDRLHLENGSHGIVMNSSKLKSGADIRSETLQDIDPGIKAGIIDSIGVWYKLNLPDLEQGWIEKTDVQVIK